MHDLYMDNPEEIERMLDLLTDKEVDAFNKGYMAALMGVTIQFSETKTKIMSRIMDEEPGRYRRQLEAKVHILDVFEKHFRKRVKVLEPTVQG